MGRIVIASELYFPEETSTGFFVTKIAEGIAASDICEGVCVICSQPSYRQKGIIWPVDEIRKKVQIHRIKASRLNKNSLPARILLTFSVTFRLSFLLLKHLRKGDVLVMLTNPPALPFLATLIAKSRKIPCVVIIHDVYPDVLVPTGVTRSGSLIYRLVDGVQAKVLGNARKLIVLGRDMKERIQKKTGGDGSKIRIIPHWGFLQAGQLDKDRIDAMRERFDLVGKFVIQFSGNLGRTHGIGDVLGLAERFRDDKRFHFFIFGEGSGKQWLESQIKERGLNNITLRGACSMEDLPYYLSICDLFFLPFLPGMEGISVPSRMYNVLALGNPILAATSEASELAQVITEEGIGLVAPPGELEIMAQHIELAYRDPDSLAGMRRRAMEAWQRKYTESISVSQYTETLQEVFTQEQMGL